MSDPREIATGDIVEFDGHRYDVAAVRAETGTRYLLLERLAAGSRTLVMRAWADEREVTLIARQGGLPGLE